MKSEASKFAQLMKGKDLFALRERISEIHNWNQRYGYWTANDKLLSYEEFVSLNSRGIEEYTYSKRRENGNTPKHEIKISTAKMKLNQEVLRLETSISEMDYLKELVNTGNKALLESKYFQNRQVLDIKIDLLVTHPLYKESIWNSVRFIRNKQKDSALKSIDSQKGAFNEYVKSTKKRIKELRKNVNSAIDESQRSISIDKKLLLKEIYDKYCEFNRAKKKEFTPGLEKIAEQKELLIAIGNKELLDQKFSKKLSDEDLNFYVKFLEKESYAIGLDASYSDCSESRIKENKIANELSKKSKMIKKVINNSEISFDI